MKKTFLLLFASVCLCACTISNKNLLSEKIAKYPNEKYLTKIAAAQDKKTAQSNALVEIKTLFDTLPKYENSDIRRQAILSDAYVGQWWKDKSTGKYYAIAVLERKPAQDILLPYYQPIDGNLNSLQTKISAEKDKFLRLQSAIKMPDLFKEREKLDTEYRLLSFDASSYNEDKLYAFKSSYTKAFYDIKINATITGLNDTTVKTILTDALNSLGFSVGENLKDYDIDLGIETKTDNYPSQSTDGLFWSTATANVTLKDKQTEGVFAAFSQSQRIGASRAEDAQRRSLIAAGEACVPVIKEKLVDYINKK